MTMKSVLLPFEESPALPSMLESALLVARRFGSYIEGLHVRLAQSSLVLSGEGFVSPELLESFRRQDVERTQHVRNLFDTFMGNKGIVYGEAPRADGEPCAGWREAVAPSEEMVGSRGRVFDVIVVGRPVRGSPTPGMGTLEAALFDSGRPVLIAPPVPPSTLGQSIAIAWNGSSETARTIALALPFLVAAERVTVISAEESMVPGPSGAEIVRYLEWNGVRSEAIDIGAGNRPVGEAILAAAGKWGADMLIKGGYTHSRIRQMIFGGATQQILAAAELPVFMAH
ncbi:MAG: universal stress protein UspA [Rhodospirillaceae bacterium]|nr:universal stress protein UspA [Rhodospirillaceae bacterium]